MASYQPARLAHHWLQDPERLGFVRGMQALGEPGATPDLARMAAYRYARLQAQLSRADCAGALLLIV